MARPDVQTGDLLYIDVDIIYEDFKRSRIWARIQEKIPAVCGFIGAQAVSLKIRPSSSGNAHIEVKFDRPLHILENIAARAWLHDDPVRLRLDLVRYLRTGDPRMINRLWSGKYKRVDYVAELKLCGAWEQIPIRRPSIVKDGPTTQGPPPLQDGPEKATVAPGGHDTTEKGQSISLEAKTGKKTLEDWPEAPLGEMVAVTVHQVNQPPPRTG